MPATSAQRLAFWEGVHRSRFADWERRRAGVVAALARGDSRRAIMRAYGLTYHLVRSLDEQRLGLRPFAPREREPSWAEVNRRLAAAVRRLEGP